MNQSLLILIVCIAGVCIWLIWFAWKKGRNSVKTGESFAQRDEPVGAKPSRSEGQTEQILEPVVQPTEGIPFSEPPGTGLRPEPDEHHTETGESIFAPELPPVVKAVLAEKGQEIEQCSEPATSEVTKESKLGVPVSGTYDGAKAVRNLLQWDSRAAQLRRLVTQRPAEAQAIADQIFDGLPQEQRVDALSDLVALLLRARDPVSDTPLLSTRYHIFLRSLEGAFLSFCPNKKVLLDRRAAGETALFEVGLCRECGQHYLVGKVTNDRLLEAVRDPGRSDFGATFFLPIE